MLADDSRTRNSHRKPSVQAAEGVVLDYIARLASHFYEALEEAGLVVEEVGAEDLKQFVLLAKVVEAAGAESLRQLALVVGQKEEPVRLNLLLLAAGEAVDVWESFHDLRSRLIHSVGGTPGPGEAVEDPEVY